MNGPVRSQRSDRLRNRLFGSQISSHHKKEEIAMAFQHVHRGYRKDWWGIQEDIIKFLPQL